MQVLTQTELEELVNELSIQYFQKPFYDQVMFNHRLRTTGGRYIPNKRTIELNPKYMKELGKEEFIGIIKHELVHYHLHIAGKGYQHRDREFKQLLKQIGAPRHCTPLPSKQQTYRHQYQCKECGQVYHRMKRMNVSRYRCGKCNGKIKKVDNK
ncbi:hypothetical protein J416_11200 [Gracilibacillus halophilus YIM-C55.5]|uniref:Protein SprT-like n=1 Tax=Gracilibacillus halophilus YIM-C55.5 TaxID=1308866 RepID=N4WJQ2_9BACI|nr:SprT family protein [Gracilibacillus halophilus]ENH96402.1 hypothetical protein J416_11200 [Gracilibacillus halophilus YIM-C55.5]